MFVNAHTHKSLCLSCGSVSVISLVCPQMTVNWFQMQQSQNVSLPTHYQALSDGAKMYEPGECYAEFVRNLPRNLPKERVHSESISSDNTRYEALRHFHGQLYLCFSE